MTHGNPIWIKAENLQPSGSFKIRGATYTLSLLSKEQKKAGVIAYSTGNHAQAVALAARSLGMKATIVMSRLAHSFKVEATQSYGAHIVYSEDPSSSAVRKLAESLARKEGAFLLPNYDHPDVIAGQGTIGLEILDAIDPEAVIVPIGGGGLIAGIATAVKKKKPNIRMIGVETELENDAYQSFQKGHRVSLPGPSDSIADAIKIQTLGDLPYPIICKYVDEIVQVSEEQTVEATLLCLDKAHLVVEPSGALALAAALAYKKPLLSQKPVVCVASGGNFPLFYLCKMLIDENRDK